MNAEKLEKLKAIQAAIRELFGQRHIEITLGQDSSVTVTDWSVKKYQEATEWLRSWGFKQRDKTPYSGEGGLEYTQVQSTEGDYTFRTFPDELPPTCKKVEYIETVPKTDTVQTGEFVEIKRTKIVCGGEARA